MPAVSDPARPPSLPGRSFATGQNVRRSATRQFDRRGGDALDLQAQRVDAGEVW